MREWPGEPEHSVSRTERTEKVHSTPFELELEDKELTKSSVAQAYSPRSMEAEAERPWQESSREGWATS